jgi:hypothetical protein
MSAYFRPLTFGLVILFILAGLCLPASANSVSVSVTGVGVIGGTSDFLRLDAGNFSAESGAPDGPTIVGSGTVGVPMTLEFFPFAFSGLGFTVVTIGNQFTDILTGGIDFTTGTFTVPASALVTGIFTVPVDVLGQVMAFRDLGGHQGPLLASLYFTGTGTATLYLADEGNGFFTISIAEGDFKKIHGTLTTPVPETSSLLMMGTGLVAVGTLARRKRGFRRRTVGSAE